VEVPSPNETGVVLLAAGRGRRMGCQKLLLPWGGTSVLGHHLDQWRSRARVLVVWSDPAVALELDRLAHDPAWRVCNGEPDQGMWSSVQTAAAWDGWPDSVRRVVLVLGDQPGVRPETLDALLSCRDSAVVRPAAEGRNGHPVVLRRDVFDALGGQVGPTLRDALAAWKNETVTLPVADGAVAFDIDTPEDYARATELK
jgi:molybdenum cofactor cytidylyltransferase